MRKVLVLAVVLSLQGCYYLQATHGQLQLLAKRTPIEEVIAAPATDARLRARLTLVVEMRRFAVTDLALPDNDSYSTYADLGRPYPLWSVTVTEEFSVDPLTWCFPFAGCVAYRGYFAEAGARRFAEGHARRGRDVRVGGVTAYSTLGWFSDPVLNSMVDGDEAALAAVLFHELAHQQFYAKGDTAFSEAFATVVERAGVRRWLHSQADPAGLAAYEQRIVRLAEFALAVDAVRTDLRALYAGDLDLAGKRERKRQALVDLGARFGINRELNNADLAAVATYNEWVPALEALLAESAGDLRVFYREVAALARLDVDTRRARLLQLR